MPVAADPVPRPLDHLAECGHPDNAALVLRGQTLSYAALRDRVGQLAAWLQRIVPEPGARVVSWCAKGELTCLLPLAAARAGFIHVPINPVLKRLQVAHILADSGARLLIGTQARLASLEAGDITADCAAIAEQHALADSQGETASLPPSAANPDDLAAILYTSGSTGRPKGVMLSHANLWLGAVSVAHYLGLAEDDVILGVLPLSFDYGQNQLLSAWRAGASVVPLDYLLARDVPRACARHGVTTLAAVPPLWRQLCETEWPDDATRSIRRLTNSGGALTPDLVKRLRARFPQAQLFAMYGLTEAFRSTYLDPALIDRNPTSIGKPIPFAEIMLADADGEAFAGPGEGELVHCGPLVAQGYWRDAERTAERFRPAPAGSSYGGVAVWSGDRVRRAEDGLLYFAGRNDEMIKSSGNRISPQEIEEVALGTGLVVQAAAIGVPDKQLGESVHLVCEGQPGARDPLREKLSALLPNYMQPKHYHFREQLPLNSNGKIDRATLKLELTA